MSKCEVCKTITQNKRFCCRKCYSIGFKFSEKTKTKMSIARKTLFINGFIHPMKNKHHSEESKKKMSKSRRKLCADSNFIHWSNTDKKDTIGLKISNSLKGKKKSIFQRQKISKTLKMKYSSGIIIHPMKGKHHSMESIKKISDSKKGHRSHRKGLQLIEEYGCEKAEEIRKKNSVTQKKLYDTGKKIATKFWTGKKFTNYHRQKQSEKIKEYYSKHDIWNKGLTKDFNESIKSMSDKNSCIIKKLWENKDYREKQIKAILNATIEEPNESEKKLFDVIQNNNLPYKYVGNGEVIIGFKNPDFINVNGEKKVIELYGDYWHRNDNPQDRIDHFKKYGFDCLVIWERELKNKDSLFEKLKEFDRRKQKWLIFFMVVIHK